MFAPKRGTTVDDFATLASSTFNLNVQENYDSVVWDLHCKVCIDHPVKISIVYCENW